MKTRKAVKHLRHGEHLAEVEVEMREHPGKEWSPTMSLEDVRKLERVRKALERGDIEAASKEASVYRLTPVSAA